MIAIFYALLAGGRLFSKKIMGDDSFRSFGMYAISSTFAFVLAHAFEYVVEVMYSFPDGTAPMIVINLYAFAFLLIVIGADGMLRQGKVVVEHVRSISRGLLVVTALVPVLAMFPVGRLRFRPNELSTILFALMLLCLSVLTVLMLRRLARRFREIEPFVRYATAAVGLVFLSSMFEAAHDWMEAFGMPEYRGELLSHYFFYFALAIFYLSFEQMRHFGGAYAEVDDALERE